MFVTNTFVQRRDEAPKSVRGTLRGFKSLKVPLTDLGLNLSR